MRIIRNFDVASYYPHLITINGYASRNMSDPEVFSKTLDRRMVAKKAGDKVTANALKLIVNTAYGATKNGVGDTAYNALYDPLMARSVCISGQLYLIELANHLVQDIPDLKIVQLNTDGIMIEFDESQYPKVLEITDEWQKRTGFELEEDKINAIYQKDVNNYIEVAEDGSLKTKGGYLVRGTSTVGAFKINNDANIVATAIVKYFTENVDPADTIMNCDDIKQFQFIAKGSSKYSRVYQLVDGEEVTLQRVNRVYATSNQRYGTLYKIKAENGQVSKMAGLPEHCIVDNDNHLTISDVDKAWYVVLAQSKIQDFIGRPEKKGRKSMATAKSQNVFQRLADAREEFMASDIDKSGKNFHLKTTYWELKDIVPTAMRCMHGHGLIPVYYFDNEFARLTVVNMENPDDRVVFQLPMRELTGNAAINPVQALGAVQTYMRRYLYLQALDICEADEIEPNLRKPEATAEAIEENRNNNPAQPVKQPETTAKVIPAQNREQIKKDLTAVDGAADAIQLEQLKTKLGELAKSGDPAKVDAFKTIMTQTGNLKNLTRKTAEALLRKLAMGSDQ